MQRLWCSCGHNDSACSWHTLVHHWSPYPAQVLWTVPWTSANHVPTLALSKEASYQISRWYININGNLMISNTNFIEGFILNLKMIYKLIQMAYMIANTNFTMSSKSFFWGKKHHVFSSPKCRFNQSLYSWVAWDWFQLHPATPDMLQSDSTTDRSAPPPTGRLCALLAGLDWCDADGKHSKVPTIQAYVSLRKWALQYHIYLYLHIKHVLMHDGNFGSL